MLLRRTSKFEIVQCNVWTFTTFLDQTGSLALPTWVLVLGISGSCKVLRAGTVGGVKY